MKNKITRKIFASLVSLAVIAPSFLIPANLRAQSFEGADPAAAAATPAVEAGAGIFQQIQTVPTDFGQTLSGAASDISESINGQSLDAKAVTTQALPAEANFAQTKNPGSHPLIAAQALPLSAVQASEQAGAQENGPQASLSEANAEQPLAAIPETAGGEISPAVTAAPKTVFGRLARFAAKSISLGGRLFDGTALNASAIDRPSDLSYGIIRKWNRPSLSMPGKIKITKKIRPLAEQGGPVSINDFYFSPGKGIVLNADPSNAASIEQALRALVDANPAKYGASSQDMRATSLELLPGTGNQADSFIAVFRQIKQGQDINGSIYRLAVEGANLRFHIKAIDGKPIVMAVEGGFVPDIDTSVMAVHYTDKQLDQIAVQQISSPQVKMRSRSKRSMMARSKAKDAPVVQFLTRQLTFINGAWLAVNVYEGSDLNGNSVIVLVDVNSGQAYAVNPDDMRYGYPGKPMTLRKAGAAASTAQARGTTLTQDGQDHGPTGPMPLINTYVYDAAGNVLATTDANGAFTLPASLNGGKPVRVTVKLDGIYGQLIDEDSKDVPIAATMAVTPGQPVTITLNPTGDDEQLDADVNGYVYPYQMIEWIKSMLGLGGDARFFQRLRNGIHANGTEMVANAFYDPTTDAFYLMKSGKIQEPASQERLAYRAVAQLTRVPRRGNGRSRTITLVAENTAQPSIELHEFGHRQYQVASQILMTPKEAADPANRFITWLIDPIIGSESNEAGADTFSMFIRNSPVIGNGFFLRATPASAMPEPNIIRTGENQTAYDASDAPNDDPHQQGETQMGTAWMTYQDLIAEMGQPAALKYAAKLFIRTWLYIQPGNAITALAHAVIADMAKDGTIPHENIIRGHAQNDHGATLPTNASASSRTRSKKNNKKKRSQKRG